MNDRQKRRLALVLVHSCSALIVLQLGNFYGFVLRARLALGVWPAPYRPDPKELGFDAHYDIVVRGGLPVLFIPLVAPLLFAVAKHVLGLPRLDLLRAARILAFCFVGFLALFFLDPGDFGEWFRD